MYDIIIIGAGTAGISAYKQAIKKTKNILIINEGAWDTTCARVGCMPSKVLISTANRMHDIQHAENVSLITQATIDTSKVMQHVRDLRDRFTRATLKDVKSWDPQHKISGRATFIDKNTVLVNGNQYQAESFIIAVGSKPSLNQEWKETLKDKLITSNEIFELETLPKSIAVVGSGVIAIELAQAMQRLGVETTVFARSRKIGSLSSPKLQALAQTEISKELDIKFEILPDVVKKDGQSVSITYTEDHQQKKINVDYLLLATGRTTHLGNLNLRHIDSSFEDVESLPINKQTKQLSDLPIFIVGDAFTNTPIQHEAAHEGKLAVNNCLNYPKVKNLKTLTPLGIMFSSPEMATVGQSYKQLKDQNIRFITGLVHYEKQGRAIVLGKNKGALELYIDINTRKLLGAELLVESAEHLAHLLCWMISEELSIDDILQKPFYHPTLEEGIRTALKHARRQLDTAD
ncbi:dihydrolipoyl dehydrogenase [Acinetobacter sp. 187]|uniref:dihydrolipoyl dehydrogenase n=1 Tax=Acinetobacter lanii TaxID=2715163 RepID=UPI00140D694A|nr:dihydrolipoyl dehydrogenase [Acinetobacter lanii]NHC04973.1 dihydrolipoyl dehydrogenase [Acinetobacter lanii]